MSLREFGDGLRIEEIVVVGPQFGTQLLLLGGVPQFHSGKLARF